LLTVLVIPAVDTVLRGRAEAAAHR
jgi:hypothetical protein